MKPMFERNGKSIKFIGTPEQKPLNWKDSTFGSLNKAKRESRRIQCDPVLRGYGLGCGNLKVVR